MPVGPLEIVIVLLIALVIFGGSKLPQLGRSAGKGLRKGGDTAVEFKDTALGKESASPEPAGRSEEYARTAGKSVRDFKDSVTGKSEAVEGEDESFGQSAGRGLREFRDALAGRGEDDSPKDDDAELVQGEVVEREGPPSKS
jgi:sec-independent protein translocase protein TatA